MRLRVHLNGYVDIDIEHPDFVDLLDPTKPQDHAAVEDRVWIGLDGYLSMLITQKGLAGFTWELASAENICRVCGCTEDAACEGGCSWREPDLCSAHAREEAEV